MTDLTVYQQDENVFLAPATNVHGALQRYQDMKDFVERVLKNGYDYGVIPGTGTKPTLLKPGAEKLCAFFGLTVTYHIIEKELDWMGTQHGGEPFFFFNYGVKLLRSGRLAGEGEGSCNSWEKKYRYRKGERICPKCGKPTIIKGKAEFGGGWICFAKKGGCGAKFRDKDQSIEGQNVEDIINPDIADAVNTIQKMAQKRALIAATLNATNASDWFTQDIEDFVEGGFVEWEPEKVDNPQSQPEEQKVPASTVDKPEPEPQFVQVDMNTRMVPVMGLADAEPEPQTDPFATTRNLDPKKLTLEEAKAVRSGTNGHVYGDLPIPDLAARFTSMTKMLKDKSSLSGDDIHDYEVRIAAVKLIMAEHNSAK